MAKSKAQKREEAQKRFRALYNLKLAFLRSNLPGGIIYQTTLMMSGDEEAQKKMFQAINSFERYCVHAGINVEGEPLDPHSLQALKDWVYKKKLPMADYPPGLSLGKSIGLKPSDVYPTGT